MIMLIFSLLPCYYHIAVFPLKREGLSVARVASITKKEYDFVVHCL